MTRTVVLRTILIASLLMAVVTCATLSYFVLRNTEQEVGRQTYQSIASSALTNAKSITMRKLQGSELVATLMGHVLPDASDWPLIEMKGYMPIGQKVAQLSLANTQSLMVILENPTREEQTEFEAHVQEQYKLQGHPADAGMSDFGFGIWKPDPAAKGSSKTNATTPQYKDGRLPDVSADANTTWGGKHKILVPLTFHNQPAAASLMYNTYSEKDRGMHFDSMFDCIQQQNIDSLMTNSNNSATNDTSSTSTALSSPACPVITDILELKIRPGPAALLFQPIFPAHAPTKLVGLATTSVHWEEVLDSVVPDYVDGLTCVISTSTTTAYTYEIRRGKTHLIGQGDWHDVRYTNEGQSVILNDFTTGTRTSAVYTLTVYPTDTMLATFSTNSPLAVALGFFGVIAVCTFIFFMYDFFMRHEAHQRKAILETKRRFVRFISHEIRTPLNTVCMGLELLESELHDAGDKAIQKEAKEEDGDDADPQRSRAPCCDHDLDSSSSASNSCEDLNFWHQVTVDVKENALVAVSILNDLLNYDKLETGTLKLETDPVCIWQLVERTIHQFRIQAVNRKIDLKLDISKPPPSTPPLTSAATTTTTAAEDFSATDPEHAGGACPEDVPTMNVIGDDVRLGQVLRNVISNALKFTPAEGSIQVTAEYMPQGLPNAKPMMSGGNSSGNNNNTLTARTSYPRAGAIRITVKDSGVGLTKEQLQMLFSEGVQFDANLLQQGGGSGLGLAIAKGIVEQHGGTIRAESEGAGMGTSFVIELPLYRIPFDALLLAAKENSGDTLVADSSFTTLNASCASTIDRPIPSPFKKVLVVEDTSSSRRMLIRLLERAGHVCIPAVNGQEAVDAILKDMQEAAAAGDHVPIDTILMDFEMPILKGPDATKQIRELGWPGTVLGITGNVLEEDVDFFLQHGANDVLAKPVSLKHINSYWDQERQESALAMKRKKRESLFQQNNKIPPCKSKRNMTIPQQQPEQPASESDEGSILVEC
jgi:signal transduction histidine kinase/DNA-binding response OmpR family regulator